MNGVTSLRKDKLQVAEIVHVYGNNDDGTLSLRYEWITLVHNSVLEFHSRFCFEMTEVVPVPRPRKGWGTFSSSFKLSSDRTDDAWMLLSQTLFPVTFLLCSKWWLDSSMFRFRIGRWYSQITRLSITSTSLSTTDFSLPPWSEQ